MVLCVVVALATAEVGMRLAGRRFSNEIAYIQDIPARASGMAKSKEFRVLIMGNSLTREGFRQKVFCQEMQANHARPMHVEVVAMNGADTCEWYYLLKDFFADPNRMPDLVIINVGKANDRPKVKISRMALYIRAGNIAPLMEKDVPTFADRCDLLHSFLFTSFANRQRVQLATLLHVIPHYREGVKEVQNAIKSAARVRPGAAGEKLTFHRIERIARMAREKGVPTVLVQMPMVADYPVQPGLREALAQEGGRFVDCRDFNKMLAGKFADATHIGPKGAPIFSREYAKRLLADLPDLFAARSPQQKAVAGISTSQNRHPSQAAPR